MPPASARSRSWFAVAAILLPIVATGCAATIADVGGNRIAIGETSVRLHDHELRLHVTAGNEVHRRGPLVIYATGDAGWFGKDKALFGVVARWGYPTAGFSARDYVHHLGAGSEVERPIQLATDYAAIIAAAEAMLRLDPNSTDVVLVGKSRGAGLEIAAASTPRLRRSLRGVLAIGLTREEEYVERRAPGAPRSRPRVMLQTYDVLPRIGQVPVAVIQSSRDDYLPAADARPLFGNETSVRRFSEIPSADHNFKGALPELYAEMERSFSWILQH